MAWQNYYDSDSDTEDDFSSFSSNDLHVEDWFIEKFEPIIRYAYDQLERYRTNQCLPVLDQLPYWGLQEFAMLLSREYQLSELPRRKHYFSRETPVKTRKTVSEKYLEEARNYNKKTYSTVLKKLYQILYNSFFVNSGEHLLDLLTYEDFLEFTENFSSFSYPNIDYDPQNIIF